MRRRKRRFNWFPVLPTVYGEGGSSSQTFYDTTSAITETFGYGETAFCEATPLLFDQTEQPSDAVAGTSLRDLVEGQDYVTERIVGKCWGGPSWTTVGADPGIATPRNIILGAGIAVFPVNEAGAIDLTPDQYDPFKANNSAQPWAWRRTWALSNPATIALAAQGGVGQSLNVGYPISIGGFGSREDGGHIDCASARRVTKEQRLFFVMAGASLDPLPVEEACNVRWGVDLRILGGMRKSRNRSIFG